jgi:glycosyltransferase involved in cell wall biosynthesis
MISKAISIHSTLYIDGFEQYSIGRISYSQPLKELKDNFITEQYDIVHVCNFMAMLLVNKIRHIINCPIIFTFFNTPVPGKRAIGYYKDSKDDIALAESIIKTEAYDKLVAGSRCYYDAAIRLGANKQKTVMSYLGIDRDELILNDTYNINSKINYYFGNQLKLNEQYILLPSRITPQKGIITAIEALAIVNKTYDIKLILTGMYNPFDKRYARRVLKIAESLGIDHMLVIPSKHIQRHHLPLFYKNSSLVIIPSLYEGLGLSAIEALALGCPLIAAKTTGLDEVVRNRYNGLTFSPENATQLSTSIMQIISDKDLRTKLKENSVKSIKKFDINSHVDFLEKEYNKLISN